MTNRDRVSMKFLTVIALSLVLAACGQQGASDVATDSAPSNIGELPAEITELVIIDTVEGDGATASPGQQVVVHYTGWLYEPAAEGYKGTRFDSSHDRNNPFSFDLGAGRVIQGWDQGFAGMQVGGQRVLVIPSHMAYGERGAGAAIPPNSTLLFEVELLDVQ